MSNIDDLVGALRNRGRLRLQFEGLDDSPESLARTQEYRGAAEIERLREALEFIVQGKWGYPEGPVQVAKNALAGEQLY